MPDISMLVELAEFYEVEVRGIIDGERKSEIMKEEVKDTLLLISDYADAEKKKAIIRAVILNGIELMLAGVTIGAAICILFGNVEISAGFAVVPMFIAFAFSVIVLINSIKRKRKS